MSVLPITGSLNFLFISLNFLPLSLIFNPLNGCVLVSVSVQGGAKNHTLSKYGFIKIIIYEFVFRQVQMQNCEKLSVNFQVLGFPFWNLNRRIVIFLINMVNII